MKRKGAVATWHVVSNDVGTILAVYGSALLSDSQETARRIARELCCPTFVHHVTCERPRVGDSISMCGFHVEVSQ